MHDYQWRHLRFEDAKARLDGFLDVAREDTRARQCRGPHPLRRLIGHWLIRAGARLAGLPAAPWRPAVTR